MSQTPGTSGLQDILKTFGLSESVKSIRLSRGVVGRTTYAVVAFLGVVAVAAWRAAPEQLLWVAVIAGAVFLAYFFGVLVFASKNPGAALLEGAELLHWQKTELAAKGTGPVTGELGPAIEPPAMLPSTTPSRVEAES